MHSNKRRVIIVDALRQLKNSIGLRYFIAIASVLIVGQFLFSIFLVYTNFLQQRDDLHHHATTHAAFVSSVIPDNILANNFYPIETLMHQTADVEEFVYSVVIRADGRAITTFLNGTDLRVQEAVANADDTTTLTRVNYLSTMDGIIEVESEIVSTDLLGRVRLGFSEDSLYKRLQDNVISTFVASSILALLLAIVTIVLFNLQIRKPLYQLGVLADEFAKGNYDKRSLATGNTEISQIQRAFNDMATKIQDNIDELNKLSQVASRTKNAVIISDATGRIEWVNQAFVDITGYTLEEVKGKTPGSLLQGEKSDPEIVRIMGGSVRNGEGFNVELINYHKSGRAYWIAVEVRPVYDENGTLTNFIAIETDITERKRSEAIIRESEALKSGILETALDAIISINHEGNIIEFNPSAETIFGYQRADIIGKAMGELIVPPKLRDGHSDGLQRYLDTRTPHVLGQRIELSAMRADGTEFPIELAITALEHNDNPIFTAHLRDISERKEAEETLQRYAYKLQATNQDLSQQEARLRSLIQVATETLDIEQQLNLIVEEGAKALGMSVGIINLIDNETLIIKASYSPDIAIPSDARLVLSETLCAKTIEQGDFYVFDASQENYDCTNTILPFETKAYLGIPIWIGKTIIGTLSFMSGEARKAFTHSDFDFIQLMSRWVSVSLERQQSREELSDYATELERSNRELQQFAYSASHDLQEPLRKIQTFGSRIAAKYGDRLDERGNDYLERMQNSASRMQTLIQDLLTLSRVTTQAQPLEMIDLNEIISAVLGDLELQIENKQAELTISTLPHIKADATQMRQLFQNLIGNAMKFSHKDVAPEISISCVIHTKSLRREMEIWVSDNGIGFDEQHAERIFSIFQRLHGRTEYEGTGIGLALCRKIVERHNGIITASSKPGQGATFIIKLPLINS